MAYDRGKFTVGPRCVSLGGQMGCIEVCQFRWTDGLDRSGCTNGVYRRVGPGFGVSN